MDDDRTLLRQYVLDGSDAAFSQLVERHGPMVTATLTRRLGDPAEAADAAQAVFLLLARKAPALIATRQWVRPVIGDWLFRTASHVAANSLRQRARRRRHEHAAGQQQVQAVAVAEPEAPGTLALEQAIDALPTSLRQAIVLHYLEGMQRPAVARALGTSEAALKKRLQRSLALLRRRLSPALEEPALAALVPVGIPLVALQAPSAAWRAGTAASPAIHTLTVGAAAASTSWALPLTFAGGAVLAAGVTSVVVLHAGGLAAAEEPPRPPPVPAASVPAPAYHLVPGMSFAWCSELTWAFHAAHGSTVAPSQLLVPQGLHSMYCWRGTVLPAAADGSVRVHLDPIYAWEILRFDAHAPNGIAHQAPVAGFVLRPALDVALREDQVEVLTTGVDVFASDYAPLLTYLHVPDLLLPVPATLGRLPQVPLSGWSADSTVSHPAAAVLQYRLRGVHSAWPTLFRMQTTVLGQPMDVAVGGSADLEGEEDVHWDAAGLPHTSDGHLRVHLVLQGRPALLPNAAPVALVEGELVLHRDAELLIPPGAHAETSLAAMRAAVARQLLPRWQQAATASSDPQLPELVHAIAADLAGPTPAEPTPQAPAPSSSTTRSPAPVAPSF